MGESADIAELAKVSASLEEWERRCTALMDLLGTGRSMPPAIRVRAAHLYAELKTDLRIATKGRQIDCKSGAQAVLERCYYEPALQRAAAVLRPPPYSHPIRSRWSRAVSDARSAFSHYRQALELSEPRDASGLQCLPTWNG